MQKIVIAGGTGFLGRGLMDYFTAKGDEVTILSRRARGSSNGIRYVQWDGESPGPWVSSIHEADIIINLNGKSVDCRYNDANKALIYSTRLDATTVLGQAIQAASRPPQLWINAASATIYRHALDREMDEITGEYGKGFSVDVCQKWEQAFNSVATPGTRKVLIRTAIVLGKNGGALKPLERLARLGLGGKQGSGDQYFSWLHSNDFNRIIQFLIDRPELEGAYNVTAPTPVTNRQLMTLIRKGVGMPFGMPLPVWVLKLGAVLIQTDTELVLKSRRVVPRKLLDAGYSFQFERIEDALGDLL